MFGRDKDKGPDLNKINEAVSGASSSGVRNLSARQNGNVIEIHGQADSIAEKQNAFKTITDRVGARTGHQHAQHDLGIGRRAHAHRREGRDAVAHRSALLR